MSKFHWLIDKTVWKKSRYYHHWILQNSNNKLPVYIDKITNVSILGTSYWSPHPTPLKTKTDTLFECKKMHITYSNKWYIYLEVYNKSNLITKLKPHSGKCFLKRDLKDETD